MEDIDFRVKVTRQEFEDLCQDLFERIGDVIKGAMDSSEVIWVRDALVSCIELEHLVCSWYWYVLLFSIQDEISDVILMGGGTRIPKVQEMIKKATGR